MMEALSKVTHISSQKHQKLIFKHKVCISAMNENHIKQEFSCFCILAVMLHHFCETLRLEIHLSLITSVPAYMFVFASVIPSIFWCNTVKFCLHPQKEKPDPILWMWMEVHCVIPNYLGYHGCGHG